MTTPLITVEEAKQHLDIRPGATEFDARIGGLVESATQLLENHARQKFAETAVVEFFDTKFTTVTSLDLLGDSFDGLIFEARESRFRLKRAPVDTTKTFTVNYDVARNHNASTDLLAEQFILNEVTGWLRVLIRTSRAPNALKVSYTAGFVASGSPATLSEAAPADLKMACVYQVLYMWTKTMPQNLGRTMDESRGETDNTFASQNIIPSEVVHMMEPYRRTLIGRL